ncbi:MAG: hypothetical protein QM811_31195 [Pirellulales bacterium]
MIGRDGPTAEIVPRGPAEAVRTAGIDSACSPIEVSSTDAARTAIESATNEIVTAGATTSEISATGVKAPASGEPTTSAAGKPSSTTKPTATTAEASTAPAAKSAAPTETSTSSTTAATAPADRRCGEHGQTQRHRKSFTKHDRISLIEMSE